MQRVENEFGIEAENGWHLARIGTQSRSRATLMGLRLHRFPYVVLPIRSNPYSAARRHPRPSVRLDYRGGSGATSA